MYLTKLREIQAANTKKGWIVVGYNAIRFIPPNCSQLRCVQLGREKTLGSVPNVGWYFPRSCFFGMSGGRKKGTDLVGGKKGGKGSNDPGVY